MKHIIKEWRKYIAEEDNLEQNIYSFDYDETLIRHRPDPEDPEFGVVYDGLHEENIAKLRELAAAGHTVLIVTSRVKRTGDKHPWDTAPDPEELIAKLELPPKLLELRPTWSHLYFQRELLQSGGLTNFTKQDSKWSRE